MKKNDIKSIIGIFLKNNKLENGLLDLEVKKVWYEIMDNGIANYTIDTKLKNSTLYIKLSSPALKHELNYGKQKLVRMINKKFDKEIIEKIVIS